MTKRFGILLVGVFFLLQLVCTGASTYFVYTQLRPASDPGWYMSPDTGRPLITSVDEGGPGAALRRGDEIVALDGEPLTSSLQILQLFSRLEPGGSYRVTVRRDGQMVEMALRSRPVPFSVAAPANLARLLFPTIFLITGLAVFVLKPDDKQALLLALMFGTFIGLFQPLPSGWGPGWLTGLIAVMYPVSSFFFPVFAHFFLVFPETSPLLRRFPRLGAGLYLPHLLTFFLYFASVAVLQAAAAGALARWEARLAPLARLGVGFVLVYVVGGLASVFVSYRQAGRLARRKLRIVVAGGIAGFLPLLLLLGASLVFGAEKVDLIGPWVYFTVVFAFLLFPLSFAYAIVRHQVIPVRLMIRRSVRYVLVSQGSIVLEVVMAGLAVSLVLGMVFTRLRTTSAWVVGVVSAGVAVLVWNLTTYLHHRYLAPVIDRRFFRRAYNAQQTLSELGQELRTVPDLRALTALVSAKVQEVLQTESAVCFLRDEAAGDYLASDRPGLRLAREDYVVRRLREVAQPLSVDFADAKSWARALVGAGDPARRREGELLAGLGPALLLPIAAKDQLLGILAVGPRLGDLPFSRLDRQLLMAVAWQTALAIENAELIRQRAEEERLAHELQFATEVQRRLFPQRPPEVAALELAGVCHPARGIGGDYYDFLVLGEGRVGIAVADVSGKGLSAALLMSVIQASLRVQAAGATALSDGLTGLASSMNRLLYESTDASHYATFFYALFDEGARRLSYVNAGHNPPMLFRAAEGVTLRTEAHPAGGAVQAAAAESICLLARGGPVIGLLESCDYEHETIEVRSGDVLVAYTDGVSEAQSPEGDEFGERRLAELAAAHTHLPAAELRDRIVAGVRAWVRDAPQYDDMTLVVVKVR